MRQSYKLGRLEEKDIAADPLVQFRTWLAEAIQGSPAQGPLPDWVEANAMTLSTSDGQGRVSSRIVLLKGLEDDQFWFYTNYQSHKAGQIRSNPNVSLCFLWPHVQRQVRIEGTAAQASREQSVRYFRSRPRDSQLGALVSQQSTVVDSRGVLEKRLEELKNRYADKEIPCPDDWGGYRVSPSRFEFWQGRDSRLHDRLCYRQQGSQWIVERLCP